MSNRITVWHLRKILPQDSPGLCKFKNKLELLIDSDCVIMICCNNKTNIILC